MLLEKIRIKGFRNFDDTEISFHKKTLIIGANDVGKTNLLYALRLLFDKSISEHDLELKESDFNAYSGTSNIEITVTLSDVTEECLLSAFGGSIKDDRVLIRYTCEKNGEYKFSTGCDYSTLSEIPSRQYIKRLNMQYVDTNRNLFSFLSRERIKMFQIAKDNLSKEALASDQETIEKIQDTLNDINEKVSSLEYISKSLEHVNKELGDLSVHNEDQEVCFVAGESKVDKLLDNLVLAYSTNDTPLSIGGDGRINQIFLATWIAKQHLQENVDHITFYAIEEPEAHLHPHQQRKLSSYIQNSFDSQIMITTHSPHIVSKFNPTGIVRLYTENKFTLTPKNGSDKLLKKTFKKLNYRFDSLSAETFFSDGVFLVEGTSEVLFYNALAKEIGIDLDRLNISILSVEGIGFKPYIAVCNALSIPWILRTDNDIFSKKRNGISMKYYAGTSRVMSIIDEIGDNNLGLIDYWNKHKQNNEWCAGSDIPGVANELNKHIKNEAEELGLFLSTKDLETDLLNSELKPSLLSFYNSNNKEKTLCKMQSKKAENMMSYLEGNQHSLSCLKDDELAKPLIEIAYIICERIRLNND